LELIRDTHKPASSATPLFEPLSVAAAAAAGVADSQRPFPLAPQTNAFSVPLPVPVEQHHDQEDYLWGV
jgi:hypothetical protein